MTGVPNRQSKGWWESNWKWAVPVGCVGSVVLFVGFFAGILLIITGSIKSSWAYSEGVALAQRDPQVVAALGEPVEPAWYFSGSINIEGSSGEADLAIPLRGSNGRGTLYVVAEKRAGEWSFESAEVEVSGRSDRIDLLARTRNSVSIEGPGGRPT